MANCSSPTCSHDGTLHCAGCKSTAYCSHTCQKTHWPTHKQTCTATQKHNCYLVRAASSTDFSPLVDQISPLHLQHYGNEMAEIQEIKSRCGWSSVSEVGKFYDHLGTDSWYYYVYGQRKGKAERKSFNAALSMACSTTRDKEIYGDVAVIRSGPSNDEPVPERFTSGALAKALDFYKDKDCEQVFVEREKSRCGKKMGVDMSTVSAFEVRA